MASDRTERATPKRRDEARRKGQVARSMDLNGAVILLTGLLALSTAGPGMVRRMEEALVALLTMAKNPAIVDQKGVGELFASVGRQVALAAAPFASPAALAAC